jgi:hypothetical protein
MKRRGGRYLGMKVKGLSVDEIAESFQYFKIEYFLSFRYCKTCGLITFEKWATHHLLL